MELCCIKRLSVYVAQMWLNVNRSQWDQDETINNITGYLSMMCSSSLYHQLPDLSEQWHRKILQPF